MKVVSTLALLSSTLFYASSAQATENVVNNLIAEVDDFINKTIITTEAADFISYTFGEYTWTLSENNEDHLVLSVNSTSSITAGDLQASLTDLLIDVGEFVQDYANDIENETVGLFEGELYDTIQDNNGTAYIMRQFGHELLVNASNTSTSLIKEYNQFARNYSLNVNNVTNEVNDLLNNSDWLSDAADDVENTAKANGINVDLITATFLGPIC